MKYASDTLKQEWISIVLAQLTMKLSYKEVEMNINVVSSRF